MFLFPQAQEDLRLAKTKDASADLKQAEMTIQQMSAEIEALMEKLKVGLLLNVTEDRILTTSLITLVFAGHADVGARRPTGGGEKDS